MKSEEFEEASRIQKQIEAIRIITQETYDPFQYLEKPLLQIEREQKENNGLHERLDTRWLLCNSKKYDFGSCRIYYLATSICF